jgi:hypothetical protein
MEGFLDTRWEIVLSGKPAPSPPVPVEIPLGKFEQMLEKGEILEQPAECDLSRTEKCVFSSKFPVFDALGDMKANCLRGKAAYKFKTIIGWPTINGKPFVNSLSYFEAPSPVDCVWEAFSISGNSGSFAPPNFKILMITAFSAVAHALVTQGYDKSFFLVYGAVVTNTNIFPTVWVETALMFSII